jgi:hypothetical protein
MRVVVMKLWFWRFVKMDMLENAYWLSAIRFRAAQNLVNIMFILYGAAIVLIGIAGVAWLLAGHPGFTNMALSGGGWAITFGSTGNFTIFGFVILALLGIEVPLNMGVEVTNERAVILFSQTNVTIILREFGLGVISSRDISHA